MFCLTGSEITVLVIRAFTALFGLVPHHKIVLQLFHHTYFSLQANYCGLVAIVLFQTNF